MKQICPEQKLVWSPWTDEWVFRKGMAGLSLKAWRVIKDTRRGKIFIQFRNRKWIWETRIKNFVKKRPIKMALLYVKNYPIKQPFGMEPFRSIQNILNRVSITHKERSTLSIFGISTDCITTLKSSILIIRFKALYIYTYMILQPLFFCMQALNLKSSAQP